MMVRKTHVSLAYNKTTIRLQDVVLLFCLPINGNEIIRQTCGLGLALSEKLPGFVPLTMQSNCQTIILVDSKIHLVCCHTMHVNNK